MNRVRIVAVAGLVAVLLTPRAGANATVRVVVGYKAAAYGSAGDVERAANAVVVARIPALRADVVELAADSLARVRASPAVQYAEVDGAVDAFRVPNDEFLPTQWSVAKTRAEPAWDLTTGLPQTVVAVIDTGVDGGQPDLAGKLVDGFDYVNNDADANDDNGHGTAVAGVVAANSDNGIGVAGYCWSCRLMPVKVLGADGSGFDSAVAQGMVWAVDHGARVLNLSLGGPANASVLGAASQYATAHGVLVVAAAGNEAASLPAYPAALPNVLSVGASDPNDRLYTFSNAAARVAAPGENSTVGRGNYVSFLGTSSAAPVVSGIAGLAFSLVPGTTPTAVTQALETTAVPIAGVAAGRVDAYAALTALAPVGATPPPPPAPAETPRGSGSGSTAKTRKVVRGRVSRRKPFRLAFTSGAGRIDASCRVRGSVRLTLVAGARVIGRGRRSASAELASPARVVVVVRTGSRTPRRLALSVAFPSP